MHFFGMSKFYEIQLSVVSVVSVIRIEVIITFRLQMGVSAAYN